MRRGRKPEDLSGRVYNRLSVVELDASRTKRVYWKCICSCGTQVSVMACDIKSGHTKSCGCLDYERKKNETVTHGYCRTPTYNVWMNMVGRCTNQNRPDYVRYGLRGIKVCERWKKFENFIDDMGEKPPSLSLDRINNNGNYEPTNCRWATASEQRKNQRSKSELRAAAEIGKEMP